MSCSDHPFLRRAICKILISGCPRFWCILRIWFECELGSCLNSVPWDILWEVDGSGGQAFSLGTVSGEPGCSVSPVASVLCGSAKELGSKRDSLAGWDCAVLLLDANTVTINLPWVDARTCCRCDHFSHSSQPSSENTSKSERRLPKTTLFRPSGGLPGLETTCLTCRMCSWEHGADSGECLRRMSRLGLYTNVPDETSLRRLGSGSSLARLVVTVRAWLIPKTLSWTWQLHNVARHNSLPINAVYSFLLGDRRPTPARYVARPCNLIMGVVANTLKLL